MFAGLPPSSSDLAERKSVVPPSPPAHSSPLGLVLAALAPFVLRSAARTSRIRRRRRHSHRKERLCSLPVHCSLRSLRLALGSRCLPHSLATKNVSARSFVQDSGAPAWLRAAARDSRRSQCVIRRPRRTWIGSLTISNSDFWIGPGSTQVGMLLVAAVVVAHPLRISDDCRVVTRDLQVLGEGMRPFR